MKLVMTLLVRDEADIVESNIRFHLDRGVDFIIATDNLSTDETTDILREYERQGVLHYMRETDDDYSQYRWVTRMARLAATDHGADWVINNDADEFWWPENGSLKDALAEVPPSCLAASVERANFLARPEGERKFFADAMTIRSQWSQSDLGRPLPPKACHRGMPDIEVGQGNHSVLREGRQLDASTVPITILHFPIRSYRQFARKVAQGGAAYARNETMPAGIGAHWRDWYALLRNGKLEAFHQSKILDDGALREGLESRRFVVDERLKHALDELGSARPNLWGRIARPIRRAFRPWRR
jgi:glycosyl transferase family 2